MDIDNIVKTMQEKGFYILRKYKTKEFCNKILSNLQQNNYPAQNGEGGDLRIPHFQNYSKEADEFLKDANFLSIGKKLIGHDIDGKTKRCQLGFLKYKKNANSGGGWHVDNHKPQFKAMVYLTDVNENNGPFALLYPNLKSNDYPYDPEKNNTRYTDQIAIDHKDKIQLLTGNAGDTILFLSHNIHRGTNIKEGIRISLTNYYYDGIYTK